MPWWICEKCGLIHETRPRRRPVKLRCDCGGDIVPDYGAEAEFNADLERVEEFNARVGPCPDDLGERINALYEKTFGVPGSETVH